MTSDARTTNTQFEPRMCVSSYQKLRRVRCGVHTPSGLQQTTEIWNLFGSDRESLQILS